MLASISSGATSAKSSQRSPSSPTPASPTPTVLAGLDDELRDARRVLSHGQEEDLRCALDRIINKVEELSSFLKTAIKTQTELETQLNLAKSNLQLVICNNEMLEEALKRETPCSARDVGWRRWSAREVQNHSAEKKTEERPRSLDYGPLNESGTPTIPSGVATVLINDIKSPAWTGTTPQPTAQMTSQEGRFFKFRFSSGTRSPALSPHPSHLTSPSLPSLVTNARDKEIEELQEELGRERQAHKAADAAKAALEAELESLSQALFEEANRMVSTERMKRAETEEELSQTRSEKDALRQALKLVEGENGRLRSANALSGAPSSQIDRLDASSAGLPFRLSVEPPSPRPSSRPLTGKAATPPITPLGEMPSYYADFRLEPAPKPSLAGLHRRTASMEKSGIADLSVGSLIESLPVTVASSSVPLAPQPSPQAREGVAS